MNSSEPIRLSAFPKMQALSEKVRLRKEWETANPELAAIWTEALLLDALWCAERDLAEHRSKLRRDIVHQLQKLGVPQRAAFALQALEVKQPGPEAVRGWFEAMATQPRPFLVLLGKPGTGKTVAAAYACRLKLESCMPNSGATSAAPRDVCMWVASGDLAVLSSFGEADRIWFERMQAAQLLVLDDVGVEQLHSQAQQRLERLIDERYGNSRWTILTSNMGKEELAERVGARVYDRLREAGVIFNCGNQSLRGK